MLLQYLLELQMFSNVETNLVVSLRQVKGKDLGIVRNLFYVYKLGHEYLVLLTLFTQNQECDQQYEDREDPEEHFEVKVLNWAVFLKVDLITRCLVDQITEQSAVGLDEFENILKDLHALFI